MEPETPLCTGCGHPAHWRECRAPSCYCHHRGPRGEGETRYRIEYVETKNLIVMLQAAHDYAAANEHRADYWTAFAAYLQMEGLSYKYEPPRTPIDWGLVDG